jgi:RNA polymerase sigma-70 factor (ECF subfamily)
VSHGPEGRTAVEEAPVARSEAAVRERELVARAQGGDVTAFEQLYRNNANRVYGLCLRLSGDAALAQELAQDVFVRAWQRLGTFRGESAFFSWLYTLAANMTYSERRSRLRRLARVRPTDDLTPYDRPQRAATPESAVDLERAIAELPPGARTVFVMHDVHGFKHEEIARRLGIATGTCKAQLHRARRLLREALGR